MPLEQIDHVKYRRLGHALASKQSELAFLNDEWRYSRDVAARTLAAERASLAPKYSDMPAAALLAQLENDLRAEESAAQIERPGAPHGYRPSAIKARVLAFRAIVQADAVLTGLAARRDALSAELQPLAALVSRLRAYVEGADNAPSFKVSNTDD